MDKYNTPMPLLLAPVINARYELISTLILIQKIYAARLGMAMTSGRQNVYPLGFNFPDIGGKGDEK